MFAHLKGLIKVSALLTVLYFIFYSTYTSTPRLPQTPAQVSTSTIPSYIPEDAPISEYSQNREEMYEDMTLLEEIAVYVKGLWYFTIVFVLVVLFCPVINTSKTD